MTGRRVRVKVIGARVQLATRESTGDTVTAPVAIAELGIPGLRVAAAPVSFPGRCRSDLLSIDGQPVPVRVNGPASAAPNLSGLAVTPCDPRDPSRVPTITLARGEHVVRTSEGVRTGVQLDRVVLASAAGGQPLAVAGGRVTGLGSTPLPTPSITVVRNGATRVRVHVSGADNPFWLVLGQSQSDGWKATVVHTGSLGPSRLVDGYANGWLVRPNRAVVRRRARMDAATTGVGRDLDLGAGRAGLSRDRRLGAATQTTARADGCFRRFRRARRMARRAAPAARDPAE